MTMLRFYDINPVTVNIKFKKNNLGNSSFCYTDNAYFIMHVPNLIIDNRNSIRKAKSQNEQELENKKSIKDA